MTNTNVMQTLLVLSLITASCVTAVSQEIRHRGVQALDISDDGKWLATAGDESIRIHNLESLELVKTLETHFRYEVSVASEVPCVNCLRIVDNLLISGVRMVIFSFTGWILANSFGFWGNTGLLGEKRTTS